MSLSHIVRERLRDGNAEGLPDLFAFLDGLIVSDSTTLDAGVSEMHEAVIQCFLENIVEPDVSINRLYTPSLGPKARSFLAEWWPDCLGPTPGTG
jgi:hypothetical protein